MIWETFTLIKYMYCCFHIANGYAGPFYTYISISFDNSPIIPTEDKFTNTRK